MGRETKGKHKEICLGKQKNVVVDAMEIASLNKREPVGEGLGLLREQKKVNRKKRKSKRKTKQSRRRRPGTSARDKRKSVGRQSKLRRKTKQIAG